MKARKKKRKKVQRIPACLPPSPNRFDHLLQLRCNEFRVLHAWQAEFFPSCSSAKPARREANETAVLYIHIIHALLIRLFFSFFLSSCVNLDFHFFLYIEGFFEILIIRYSVVLLCLSVIYFLLSLLFSHSFMKNFSDPLRSFFLLFSFRSGLEGKREN